MMLHLQISGSLYGYPCPNEVMTGRHPMRMMSSMTSLIRPQNQCVVLDDIAQIVNVLPVWMLPAKAVSKGMCV